MAARTEEEILISFQESVQLSDPSADVKKGPLFSLIGRPLSQVLSPTEVEVDRLEKIYSAEFAKTANADEAQAFLTNWSEVAGNGTASTVQCYFMTFNRPRPDQTIPVPLGSLVGNVDQTLQYITVEAGVIRGDIADSYYNSQRRAYEIALNCVAVANGPAYELPAGRINSKVSSLPGIDGVENRVASSPGAAAETLEQQIDRVQEKFKGLAVNTPNGGYTRVRRYNPTAILDVKTILPSNRVLFQRRVYGPAIDYYILGTVFQTTNESYTSQLGGETEILLQNVPVSSINSVTINSVPIQNFALRSDTSAELRGSARAEDKLILAIPLLANDVVNINLTYNSIVRGVQQDIFTEQKLYNTDELAREFVNSPIRIEITGRALASYDPIDVENNVREVLQSLINQGIWVEKFFPNVFLQEIRRQVPGITNAQMNVFQRSTLANSDIETVVMEQNELAIYDASFVAVQIRNV